MPALLRKCHEAKERGDAEFIVWGSGKPRREFLYVDDLADAAVYLMNHYDGEEIVNVGVGEDVEIRQLAQFIGDVVGFSGTLRFDASKPDGTPRKVLDVTRLRSLGWSARTPLREGIERTYRWFRDHQDQLRRA